MRKCVWSWSWSRTELVLTFCMETLQYSDSFFQLGSENIYQDTGIGCGFMIYFGAIRDGVIIFWGNLRRVMIFFGVIHDGVVLFRGKIRISETLKTFFMKAWNLGKIRKIQASSNIPDINDALHQEIVSKPYQQMSAWQNFMPCEHMLIKLSKGFMKFTVIY